jgi:uncharacterized membrane protein YfcA
MGEHMNLKDIVKIAWAPVVAASLCCLSPVILVLLGLSTVSFATSLADTLYGDYKWMFRVIGLLLLSVAILFYFRKKGVCTLDQARKRRNEIINTVLITLIGCVIGYVVFLYVVVHYVGVWLEIWT